METGEGTHHHALDRQLFLLGDQEMTGLMHSNAPQASLAARQGFRHNMPTHALPAGGINTEQHQATTDGHDDPGCRQAEGRAKGSQTGDARHHQPGTQGRC